MKNIDDSMGVKPTRPDLNPTSPQSGRIAGANPGTVEQAGRAAPASTDTVTFTSRVSEMLKLEERLGSLPEVDDARVQEIRASIAEGRYAVDTRKIVDTLLKIERDLG